MKRLTGVIILASIGCIQACRTIKPYEKEYLLSPLMDDAKLRALDSSFRAVAFGPYERLGDAAGTSAATACPTCGG